MKRVDIKVGFKCNNQCRFCVQGNKRDIYVDKTTQEIKKILREARSSCDGVVFTGGEATIRKDILELVNYASALKFGIIQMQSNGRMFCYGKFCDEIIKAGATEFSPAVHGHTAELHDYLTSSEGSFSQTILGIKNLKARNQKVITNTVVTKSNYRHLPEIAELLVNLRVDQFQFAFVHPLGRAKENFASIVPRMVLIEPYLKKGLGIGIKAGVKVMTEAVPYCIMDGYEEYIAEKIIPPTKIYDAHGIIDNFTELRQKEGKAKGPRCPVCTYYKICEGPWKEYPQRLGWDEFKPVTNGEKAPQERALKAARETFEILIKRFNLGEHEQDIHQIRKILFSDFDNRWLEKNQKFDFSFSADAQKSRGLRFSYNNFGEKDTFKKKFTDVFSLFDGVYAIDKFKEVLDFMKATNQKHQTTIGLEWLPGERFPRFKIYFEELFHSYSKEELRLKLKGICGILGLSFKPLGIKPDDTIAAIAIDFLPEKLLNLKVYLLHREIDRKSIYNMLIVEKFLAKKALLDLFWGRLVAQKNSFYYITKRFSHEGELLSLKIYKIYEVNQMKDYREALEGVRVFLKESGIKSLSGDIAMLEDACKRNNVTLYPVISALDSSKQEERFDLYLSFR